MLEEKNSTIGFCYECQTKNGDSTKKTVYHCDLCGKWFCELHQKPKFPYFVDWETQFDVQGNPAVKSLFYSEYGRQDGHSDFVYLRRVIEAQEADQLERNRLIKEGLDRMMIADHSKVIKSSVKIPIYTVEEEQIWALEQSNNITHEEAEERMKKVLRSNATKTFDNKFGHSFSIPAGIYSIDKFYNRLNEARTLAEVEEIIDAYRNIDSKKKKQPIK